VRFISPSGQQDSFAWGDVVSGPPGNRIYDASITFPAFSETGTWQISYIRLSDAVGNEISYSESDLDALEFPTELVVVSDIDGDGISDDEDACPSSDLSDTVVIDSCDSGVENVLLEGGSATQKISELPSDSMELRLTIDREQAERKLFGLVLFAEPGEKGLPIVLRPDTGTLRVGTIDAPFSVTNLPQGEDLVLRVFIDKYVVEVFANDRQAVYATHVDCGGQTGLLGFSVDGPMSIKRLEMWRIKPTNQGFRDAQRTRIWEPDTQ
jgi:hypothetical protein